jgi:hypothetical protein
MNRTQDGVEQRQDYIDKLKQQLPGLEKKVGAMVEARAGQYMAIHAPACCI